MISYREIADTLIDNYIDAYGVKHCICYLMDIGCTKSDLIKMGFDREAVEAAEEEEICDG